MKYLIEVKEDIYGGLHGIQDARIVEIAENTPYEDTKSILRETAIDMFYDLVDSYGLDTNDKYAKIDEEDYIEHAEWNIYRVNCYRDAKILNENSHIMG